LGFISTAWLIAIVRILSLMALLFFIGQALPVVFDFLRLVLPLLPNDL
jgi:hypothetical protein